MPRYTSRTILSQLSIITFFVMAFVIMTNGTASALRYNKIRCNDVKACWQYAEKLMDNKQFHKAAEAYMGILDRLGPNDQAQKEKTITRLGMAFFRNRDLVNAEKALMSVVTTQAKTGKGSVKMATVANLTLGDINKIQKKRDRAAPFYVRAATFGVKAHAPNDPGLGHLYYSAGENFLAMGMPHKARPYFQKLIPLSVKAFGQKHTMTIGAYDCLGSAYADQRYFKEAEAHYVTALEFAKATMKEDDPPVLMLYSNIASVYMEQGKLKAANNLFNHVFKGLKKHKMENKGESARTHRHYAELLIKMGEYEQAERHAKLGETIFTHLSGPMHPEVGRAQHMIAKSLAARGRMDEAKKAYERAIEITNRHFGKDSVYGLDLFEDAGYFYTRTNDFEKAAFYHLRAIEIMLEFKNASGPGLAGMLTNFGNICIKQGRTGEAFNNYESAIDILEQTEGPNAPGIAAISCGIARLYKATKKYDEALAHYERALQITESNTKATPKEKADLHIDIALLYGDKKELDKAGTHFEKAITIQKSTLDPNDIELAKSQSVYATILLTQDKQEEGTVLLHKALAIYQANNQETCAGAANCCKVLATVYLKKKKFEYAEQYANRAIAAFKTQKTDETEVIAETHETLAQIQREANRYEEAQENYLEAVLLYKQLLGTDHPKIGSLYNEIGNMYAARDEYDKAERHFMSALKVFKNKYGDSHPTTASVCMNMGGLYMDMKKPDEAERMLIVALSGFIAGFGESNLLVGQTLLELGRANLEQGKLDEAEAYSVKALKIIDKTEGQNSSEAAKAVEQLDAIRELQSQSAA